MAASDPASGDADGPTVETAFALLLAGRLEPGLGAYRAVLRRHGLARIPTGIHLLMLDRAGRGDEAAALRDLALAEGADLAIKAGSLDVPPQDAAAEYDALIAAGTVNARMIWEYLLVLSRLGRTEEVAAMLDAARLVRQVRLGADTIADDVAAILLREERSAAFHEDNESIRLMTKVRKLQDLPDPAMQTLIAALREQTSAYCNDWRVSEHRLAGLMPDGFDLRAWGLISRGDGYNVNHIHHRGWATGIYYPCGVPGDGDAGSLRIGCPAALGTTSPGWPDLTIRPEPGLLVLMPSFCPHWTLPLGAPGLRMSVAFDLVRT